MNLAQAISDLDITLDQEAIERILYTRPVVYKRAFNNSVVDELKEAQKRVNFFSGLIAMSDDKDSDYAKFKTEIINARNYFVQDLFLAQYNYHREFVLQNCYRNTENSKQAINDQLADILDQIEALENRLQVERHDQSSKEAIDRRLKLLRRTANRLDSRLQMIAKLEEASWKPATMDDDIVPIAEKDNIYISDALKIYERNAKFSHLVPDWILELAKFYNVDHFENVSNNTELDPRNPQWVKQAKDFVLVSYNQGGHFERCLKALELYWMQMTMGVDDIEDNYQESVINHYLNSNAAYIMSLNPDQLKYISPSELDNSMSGPFDFVKKFFKEVKRGFDAFKDSFAGELLSGAFKGIKKIGESTLEALSKLPEKTIKEMKRQLDKVNFRNIVKLAKSALTIAFELNAKLIESAMKYSAFQKLDQWTGGIIGAYGRLNRVVVVAVHDGVHKVNWKQTLVDLALVGAAVLAGAAVLYTSTATTAVGDVTGLDETEAGRLVLQAGKTFVTGGAGSAQAFAVNVGTTKAVEIGTDTIVRNTSISRELASPLLSVGAASTVTAIQGNAAFSDAVKENAINKSKEIAKNRANQILKEKTNGLVTLDRLERVYSLKDKSVEDIVAEAKKDFNNAVAKIDDRANREYLVKKLQAEADRQIAKKLDEAHGLAKKYGEDMVKYLFAKYGPQYDYDAFIEPNDFLQYQFYVVEENQRLFYMIEYESSERFVLASVGVALLGLTYLAMG